VVNEWRVDAHYNIPLPKLTPPPPPEQKVSTKFDLRSTCKSIGTTGSYANTLKVAFLQPQGGWELPSLPMLLSSTASSCFLPCEFPPEEQFLTWIKDLELN
jgi:hypothetical protein